MTITTLAWKELVNWMLLDEKVGVIHSPLLTEYQNMTTKLADLIAHDGAKSELLKIYNLASNISAHTKTNPFYTEVVELDYQEGLTQNGFYSTLNPEFLLIALIAGSNVPDESHSQDYTLGAVYLFTHIGIVEKTIEDYLEAKHKRMKLVENKLQLIAQTI